jgi:hypothetical protein
MIWPIRVAGRIDDPASRTGPGGPVHAPSSFRPLSLVSIPLILIAAFVLGAFVGWKF